MDTTQARGSTLDQNSEEALCSCLLSTQWDGWDGADCIMYSNKKGTTVAFASFKVNVINKMIWFPYFTLRWERVK